MRASRHERALVPTRSGEQLRRSWRLGRSPVPSCTDSAASAAARTCWGPTPCTSSGGCIRRTGQRW